MAKAKCGSCGSAGQWELEEAQVGSATINFNKHLIGWTLFKCSACGAVVGATEGSILTIAKRQGLR